MSGNKWRKYKSEEGTTFPHPQSMYTSPAPRASALCHPLPFGRHGLLTGRSTLSRPQMFRLLMLACALAVASAFVQTGVPLKGK